MTKNNHKYAAAYRAKKAREATKDKVGIACLWGGFGLLVFNFPILILVIIFLQLIQTKYKNEVVIITFVIVNLSFIANSKGLFSNDQTKYDSLPDPEYLQYKQERKNNGYFE